MVRMNRAMRVLCEKSSFEGVCLRDDLEAVFEDGFVWKDECLLLKAHIKSHTNANLNHSHDKTGHECFVNHIHIDDPSINECMVQSVLCLKAIWNQIKKLSLDQEIFGIIGITRGENPGVTLDEIYCATVRFHVKREGENWLSDDLEAYDEALLAGELNCESIRDLNLFLDRGGYEDDQ